MLKRSHSAVTSLRPANVTKTLGQFTAGLIFQQIAWDFLVHALKAVA